MSRLSLLTATVFCVAASVSHAESVMLNPSKDNNLINDNGGALSNGTGALHAGLTGGRGPGVLRSLLAFDIAGAIPAGSIITDVELTLTVQMAGPGSGDDEYSVHRVTQDWGEGTSFATGGNGASSTTDDATWIHTFFSTGVWNAPGGDFEATASATESIGTFGPETWGSTAELVADVQAWLDDPSSNYGWILIGDEAANSSARQFASRESSTNAPVLTVQYIVPEPNTLAIALVGSVSSALLHRRRSH